MRTELEEQLLEQINDLKDELWEAKQERDDALFDIETLEDDKYSLEVQLEKVTNERDALLEELELLDAKFEQLNSNA